MSLTDFAPEFVAAVESAAMARDGRSLGSDEIRFLCPAHPDQNPSARFNRTKQVWICDACRAGGGITSLAELLNVSRSEATGPTFLIARQSDRMLATYRYTDEADNLLYEVVRYEPKRFVQRAPDGNGGWIYKLDGVRRVLYNLPYVWAAAQAGWRVYVCEGEKDADALNGLGLVATTAAMGAGKWRSDDYSDSLRGAQVVLLPDKDVAGRTHMADVARSSNQKAASIRLIELPGTGKDVSDWLAAGGTRVELERLADAAPVWEPTAATVERSRALSGPDFLALDLPPQRWLIQNHLPEQSIAYIVGLPKVFKSFYALELAFSVASGSSFLGHFDAGAPLKERRVLLIQVESSLPAFQGRVRSIAERYGTVPNQLYLLSNVPVILEDEACREKISAELERLHPELLILDPLAAMTIGDENSATEMGNVVRTLRGWRDTYNCSIAVVHHANKAKSEGNTRAGLKMRGSTALYASSEATVSIERPDDEEPRIHVRVELKDGDSPRPYVCEFNPVGSELRMTSETIRHTVTDDEIVEAVKAGNGSRRALRTALEIAERTLTERISSLEGNRIWKKPGTGEGRTPAFYIVKRPN